jgi:hypothetical protein
MSSLPPLPPKYRKIAARVEEAAAQVVAGEASIRLRITVDENASAAEIKAAQLRRRSPIGLPCTPRTKALRSIGGSFGGLSVRRARPLRNISRRRRAPTLRRRHRRRRGNLSSIGMPRRSIGEIRRHEKTDHKNRSARRRAWAAAHWRRRCLDRERRARADAANAGAVACSAPRAAAIASRARRRAKIARF